MAVDVSAVLSVIAGMVPGVVAVGLAWLTVQAAIESFRYIRDALGFGAPDPNDPNDPRNYGHDVFAADLPAVVAAPLGYADGTSVADAAKWESDAAAKRARQFEEEYGDDPDWQDVQDQRDAAFDTSGGGYSERGGRSWDESSASAAGFPLAPAVVQAYADNNGIPPRG